MGMNVYEVAMAEIVVQGDHRKVWCAGDRKIIVVALDAEEAIENAKFCGRTSKGGNQIVSIGGRMIRKDVIVVKDGTLVF